MVNARKLMDWQERLANTAHVREVADLQAAGLNPVLSAGGNGAAVPSGAVDQVTSARGGSRSGSGSGFTPKDVTNLVSETGEAVANAAESVASAITSRNQAAPTGAELNAYLQELLDRKDERGMPKYYRDPYGNVKENEYRDMTKNQWRWISGITGAIASLAIPAAGAAKAAGSAAKVARAATAAKVAATPSSKAIAGLLLGRYGLGSDGAYNAARKFWNIISSSEYGERLGYVHKKSKGSFYQK